MYGQVFTTVSARVTNDFDYFTVTTINLLPQLYVQFSLRPINIIRSSDDRFFFMISNSRFFRVPVVIMPRGRMLVDDKRFYRPALVS
jgi:hypothetical protein